MSQLEFGVSLSRLDDVAPASQRLEEQGYDYVTVGEHIFFHVPTGNGFISLAAAAGATSRIKLMTSITLLPLYPAVLAAKMAASLDVVSGGRFSLGVGIGGEYPKEFEASGVPVAERGPRTDEALEVIRRLWTDDDVHFDGRFTTLGGVTLEPKPTQQPHPPIWVAGRKEGAMRRTARFADGWLPYMYTPEMLADSITRLGEMRAETDHDTPIKPGVFIFFAVHDDRDTALGMANERLSRQYNQDFTELVGKYALAGSPDDVEARIREYADAGAETVMLSTACPGDYVDENLRLMAAEVLPRFTG